MGDADDTRGATGVDEDHGATLPDTADRSLWRAATVMLDDGEPTTAVSVRGRVEAAIAGRYAIREVIGVGGMGEVRLCRDGAIGRDVALKTLLEGRADSGVARRRFLREVRVQGQLEHPSIVPVYDLGLAPEGGLFFTMRRVRGRTLADVLDGLGRRDPDLEATFSSRKLLEAFVRVCLAVDYAHARGVIHRDVKPANIMLGDFGEVHLLDWGLARLMTDHAADSPIAISGADLGGRVGTPGYMAPEQILGLPRLQDERTDVYALGVILFEILSLRRLHQGTTFEEIARSTLDRTPLRLPEAVDVAPELEAACARAAAADRDERFASVRELAEAVERYLDGDRDLELRRGLAVARAAKASDAFVRAAAPDALREEAGLERAKAVREVTAALALDPDNAEARRLLMRLFVEVPATMPREVEAEITRTMLDNRSHFLRFGMYGIASWLFSVPFVIAMGVRSWPPVIVCTALCVSSFFYAMWLRRRASYENGAAFVLVALAFATIASTACWMGPFVLVPQAAAATTLWVVLFTYTSRERWAVIAMGVLAVVVPFSLEFAGIFEPAYTFVGGEVVLHSRAIWLSADLTLPMLVWASATHAILPAFFLGRVRDGLSAAERQLFLQAWHLRQLAS